MEPKKTFKIILKNVRISYEALWEPKGFMGDANAKYSCNVLLDKRKDAKQIAELETLIQEVYDEAVKGKWGGKGVRGFSVDNIVRDGDEEREGREGYKGKVFINPKSNTQPEMIDKSGKPIVRHDDLFSGCYCHISVNVYAYDVSGSKGIALGLNNVMVVDNDRALYLGGRANAASDFADLIEDDDLI